VPQAGRVPELLAAGQDIVTAGRQAAQRGGTRELVALDMAFHRFVYEASGNPLLLDTANLHWHHTRRVMATYLARPISFVSIWREHAAILKAIVQGRAATAERLSREHAEQSVRQLCPASVIGPDAAAGNAAAHSIIPADPTAALRH
jgi:DNA-binding GntR family transcriptional regulator